MQLARYVSLFRSRWWMIVLATVLCAGVAYAVSTHVLKKQYTATSTFEVNIPAPQAGISANNMPAEVATDAQLVTSFPVAERTVAVLHLGPDLTPSSLLGHTSCTPADLAQTFTCTFTYSSPQLAAHILSTLGQVAIKTNENNQTKQLGPLLKQVTDQIAAATKDRAAAQAGLKSGTGDTAGLTTRIATDTTTLDGLAQQESNLKIQLAAQRNSIILIDPARAPASPTSPRPMLNTLLAALVGLLIGVGAILLADYLDDSPHSPEHLANELGAPIFATLPRVARRKGGLPEMVVNPHSDAAEAYRILRTSIRFANVDSPIRSLLVTSSNTGEGKTTTAANLAVTFAQAGVRVVLIDADLRRPSVHQSFDLDNEVGLTSVLYSQRDVQWSEVLHQGPVARLHILTSGPLPPNPAELLSSRRMSRVMEHLSSWAELIIVDSPPLLAVADPLVLALMTDGVLFVTDVEQSSMHAMQRSREVLGSVGASITGIVLNKVPRGKAGYYEYATGGYHSMPPTPPAENEPPLERPALLGG
jgi:capsular exopolysaccharide synthesis family protein